MWNTLKNKNFSIFISSQTVSQFGDKLDYIALVGIIGLFPERASLLLSQMIIAITLPVIIFGPITGVLVDRWHKKKVMVICDSLRMICALLIPVTLLMTGNIYLVFIVVFFMFLLTLFFNTARSSIIPNLVPKGQILKANSLVNFVVRAATFIGMLVGGLIVDWHMWPRIIGLAGWTVAFILDAITFGISAFMLYIMKVELSEPPKREKHLEARKFLILIKDGLLGVWQELKHALQMIPRNRSLGFAMSSILLTIIGTCVIYVLVIPTIQQDLGWGTSGVGILAAAGAIGLLIGALVVGIIGHHFDLKDLMLFCFILIGGGLVLFPLLTNQLLFALVIFVAGLAISPIFIGQDTLIHQSADELVRGRMFSIRDWIYHCLIAVGSLFVGFLATLVRKDIIFIVSGIMLAVMALIGWLIMAYSRSRMRIK
jgi:DHA3 family macrolide efflux protein-like MFS transporter